MFGHNSESSLVVDFKSKQRLDPILMELKVSVLRNNMNHSPNGRMEYLGTKEGYIFQVWMV